jgi:hypothetical protein
VNAVYVYVKCSSIINASELHHTLTCVLWNTTSYLFQFRIVSVYSVATCVKA